MEDLFHFAKEIQFFPFAIFVVASCFIQTFFASSSSFALLIIFFVVDLLIEFNLSNKVTFCEKSEKNEEETMLIQNRCS